ncbi:MAG TPA: AraC family transcriptional regulator [Cyclobacteriaceae bacterium]|jgi:AraC-like DNA-binding protein|nr:AraC family transcriptional regulator [Cyclobacteriaceae bacterium]
MKPALQKSPISAERVFEVKLLKAPHFDPYFHFHSEYQLFVVLEGTGTRFIGDHVSPFKKGDLVFTGPNLPHVWRSDVEYLEENKQLATEGIVIYFHENFLGESILQHPEMFRIKQLFVKAQRGMEILGSTAEQVRMMMAQILESKDFESVLELLKILNLLSHTTEYNSLASAGYTNSLKETDTERMNDVHAFVMQNFREKINLEQAAGIANMAPASFSRYFKTHANKTFSDFLTEIRIGYACKLLIEKQISISQACYDSGFHTLSNFNRQFKAFTQHTPMEYKKKYAKN